MGASRGAFPWYFNGAVVSAPAYTTFELKRFDGAVVSAPAINRYGVEIV